MPLAGLEPARGWAGAEGGRARKHVGVVRSSMPCSRSNSASSASLAVSAVRSAALAALARIFPSWSAPSSPAAHSCRRLSAGGSNAASFAPEPERAPQAAPRPGRVILQHSRCPHKCTWSQPLQYCLVGRRWRILAAEAFHRAARRPAPREAK